MDTKLPNTRVMRITIETFSSSTVYQFLASRSGLPVFLINADPVRYYAFDTLEGVREHFLYADIKHISFREVHDS